MLGQLFLIALAGGVLAWLSRDPEVEAEPPAPGRSKAADTPDDAAWQDLLGRLKE